MGYVCLNSCILNLLNILRQNGAYQPILEYKPDTAAAEAWMKVGSWDCDESHLLTITEYCQPEENSQRGLARQAHVDPSYYVRKPHNSFPPLTSTYVI